MKPPSKEALPLKAHPQRILFTQELVAAFQTAFGMTSDQGIPPTYAALALQGVFEILNQIQVDWKGLLHASQSFEYHLMPEWNAELTAQAELKDCRLRAGQWWLQFETQMKDSQNRPIITSKSLIMVRADEEAKAS